MHRLPSAKAAESNGAAFLPSFLPTPLTLSPAQVLDLTDSPGRPCELPAALLHSEIVSGDEGPCGQLVPSAAVRWTVPSARGEPSQDGWASPSARFVLGKKREGASLLQLDSGRPRGQGQECPLLWVLEGHDRPAPASLAPLPSGTCQDALNRRQGRRGGKRLP